MLLSVGESNIKHMDWILWIYAIAAISSALAAVLAWAAKLWWAKEFSAAKEETIKAKDAQIELLKAQIESLRELSPMKVREYFISVKEQLEEFIDDLQKQLQQARVDIEQKSDHIERLRTEGQTHVAEIKRLTDEKANLEMVTKALETEGSKLLDTFSRSHELAHYYFRFENLEPEKIDSTLLDKLVEKVSKITTGKTGEVCQKSGVYSCAKHLWNIIPLAKGNRFPPCSLDEGHATSWVQIESSKKQHSGGNAA